MDGKRYSRYVDDFINSHRYINCDNAVCRNCHEMNIHIVKGLLTECTHPIQPLFTASDFSFKECMELRKQYDMSEPLPTQVVHRTDKVTNAPPLSFGCNFTQKQMAGIVSCANTYNLFCVSMLRIEDMEALFSCKEGFHIRVNNLRHVRFSKIRLSNFAGNQFLTEANFYNPRTDHGLFLPQVFHLHSLRSEVI